VALVASACAAAKDNPVAPTKKAEDAQPQCLATPKDLVVKDVTVGEGREVIPLSSVMVQYTGWLYDGCKADLKGTQFDTSRTRPVPFGFRVGAGRVIKGWDEGVVGMKEHGGKRVLIIPPDKGYGAEGSGDKIPPNAALVFEIETIGIGYYPGQGQGQVQAPPKK
jgi:FKBP-type peptidyl-prolyl cis-trans isomerase